MLKKYDAENPANKIPMTSRFIWSHPAHMLASCFGVGGCSSAPGTVGSVMAALLYIVFSFIFQNELNRILFLFQKHRNCPL